MSLKRLEDIFTRRLKDVWKTFWRCHEDNFARGLGKTPWKPLEDVLKTYGLDKYIDPNQDILKTSSEDVWVRWIYWSWSRCLEDVSKRSSEEEDERSRYPSSSACVLVALFPYTLKRMSCFLFAKGEISFTCMQNSCHGKTRRNFM